MTPTATPAYDRLEATWRRIHRFEHLHAIAAWDQAAWMPAGGGEARAEALAEVGQLVHALRTDAALGAAFDAAQGEALDATQRADLREMQRDWRLATALPPALVHRREIVTSRCELAWRTQRAANDWAGHLPLLREVVALVRDEARAMADASGLAPYDALLDTFEPGMTTARLDRLFGELRATLPALIARVVAHQRDEDTRTPRVAPQGPFPVAAQRALCEAVVRELGFDFGAGRLDVSTHPFCGGVPEDVRMTTRFDARDALLSLYGAVHECGHGRYEQGLPRDWLGRRIGLARSMGIHESQSLAFEMQLGRHPGFVARLAPKLAAAFGAQPAFEADALRRHVQRVQPSLIRVDADEVTYPAHVALRYAIECRLVEGDVEADDIPALWDEGMRDWLGVDTRGNFRDGPMQDTHWPSGLFGYFPSYALGAMYAAQWFAAMRRATPDLDARIAGGDFAPVFDWLRENVWRQGSVWTTDELARRASGEALNPAHWLAHVARRYLGAECAPADPPPPAP